MTNRTRISDIVRELELLRDEHGDLEVLIGSAPGDHAYVETRTFDDDKTFAVIGLPHDEGKALTPREDRDE